jgi:hypothetical protein
MIDWSIRQQVDIPHISGHDEDEVTSWSAVGRIYEHLACYYLSSVGFKSEIKDAAGYDILCECPNGNFFKVEVKSSTPRIRNSENFSTFKYQGLRNKASADVFMFFDRTTNHMLLKFADEIDCSGPSQRNFSGTNFSDYNTQKSLARLGSFVPKDKYSYTPPQAEEEVKLNRAWALDNMATIHKLKDQGIWQSTISKIFGLGDEKWVTRVSREDRKGISDWDRKKNA